MIALGTRTLANNKTPAIKWPKNSFTTCGTGGGRVSAPSGPYPAALGRGQGRATPQTSAWATGSQRNPAVNKIPPTSGSHPRRTRTGRLQIVMKSAPLAVPLSTDDPPLWSGLLSPTARAAALRDNQGHCLNCHETTHSFKKSMHPFSNASGCIKPELGQLGGNDDAYRRWQERMLRYRRGSETGGPRISSSKGSRHRSGRQQGQGQSHNSDRNSQDARSGYSQHGCDNGYGHNTNSSARTVHQAVPPSPASTKSAPNMRFIRRTIMIPMRVNLALSARVTDAPTGGTAPLARLPPALPGEQAYVSQDVLVPRSSSAQR